MREVQPRLHVDDRFTDDAEAEVARLDDPRVHRPHRDFEDAFAPDFSEWKRRAVVLEDRTMRIFPQRKVVLRPERVPDERPRIRVADRADAE